MGDPPSQHHVPMPPPPSTPTLNLAMLFYGLVIVGTAAIVLALYNLIIFKWCADVSDQREWTRTRRNTGPTSSRSVRNMNMNLGYSFKYKKNGENEYECAVCLSVFEEGEELRQLPNCKHVFHATCIDMWLYSHLDCPLCRTSVGPPIPQHSSV